MAQITLNSSGVASNGVLKLQSNGTTDAVTIGTDQAATFAQAANLPNTFGFKNRIINGAMMIDQRNAGASVTPASNTYTLDRWLLGMTQASKLSVQQTPSATETGYATRVAAGFTNYAALTSTSAYSIGSGDAFTYSQFIEGLNAADLGWGTTSAKTVTLSALVYSSLTGTFGGSIQNSAQNRAYPFTFSVTTANTWTQISITIAGDTSGTWLTTNGIGLRVNFGLGVGSTYSGTANAWSGSTYFSATGATSVVGTNGATFYITGVQLEKGSTATSFDYRPYGTELQLAQRYFQRMTNTSGTFTKFGSGIVVSSTVANAVAVNTKMQMRASPSVSGAVAIYDGGTSSTVTSFNNLSSPEQICFDATCSGGGLTAYRPGIVGANGGTSYLDASAEL